MRDFCPYCSSKKRDKYAAEQPYRDTPQISVAFYTCLECGTIYPVPRLDGSEILYYLEGMEKNMPSDYFPDYNIPWYDFTSRILVRLKKKFSIKTALDIGANNGKFCLQLENAGISATGIEPQDSLVKIAQMQRLNVISGIYPEKIPDSVKRSVFDLVSMNEVIYYFPDLKKTLAAAYDHISDNGILYIQSYIGDNDARRYHKSFFARPGDYLQTFPTIIMIQYWLKDSGFEVVELIPVPDEFFNILTGISPEKFKFVQRIVNMIIGRFSFVLSGFWITKVDRIIIVSKKTSTKK